MKQNIINISPNSFYFCMPTMVTMVRCGCHFRRTHHQISSWYEYSFGVCYLFMYEIALSDASQLLLLKLHWYALKIVPQLVEFTWTSPIFPTLNFRSRFRLYIEQSKWYSFEIVLLFDLTLKFLSLYTVSIE